MGPWSVHRTDVPTVVGCSYETLLRMVQAGEVTRDTILRGPSTKQLWQVARRVPGIAHLVGSCHQCRAKVERRVGAQPAQQCRECGANFGAYLDRNWYGLPDINPLPDDPAVDPSEHRQSRGMTPARSTSLSSFVTDDELLVPEIYTDAPRSARDAAARATPATAQPSAFARTASSEDGEAASELMSVAERTLIDRTRRLESTNRILLTTTVICFVLAFALAVWFVVSLRDMGSPPTTSVKSTSVTGV